MRIRNRFIPCFPENKTVFYSNFFYKGLFRAHFQGMSISNLLSESANTSTAARENILCFEMFSVILENTSINGF